MGCSGPRGGCGGPSTIAGMLSLLLLLLFSLFSLPVPSCGLLDLDAGLLFYSNGRTLFFRLENQLIRLGVAVPLLVLRQVKSRLAAGDRDDNRGLAFASENWRLQRQQEEEEEEED